MADFGRARVIRELSYTAALLPGSAPYMAPELFPSDEWEGDMDKLFSKPSDVYAFSMVSFEVSHAVWPTPYASNRIYI